MNKEWIEKLREYFFSHKHQDLNIDAAMVIKKENTPTSLYKYRDINKYSLDNLANDTVWCSNAEDFNDPYDSSLCFDFPDNFLDSTYLEYFNEHQKENNESVLSNELLQATSNSNDRLKTLIDIAASESGENISQEMTEKLHSVLTDFTKNQVVEMNEHYNKAIKKGYKVCSFSERVDSMLMWSHYSKNHTGFVMEYDFKSLPITDVRSRCLWPVIYDNKVFDASKFIMEHKNSGDFNNLFGIIASIHKAKDWSYEEEWRFIAPLGPSEPPYNQSVPKPTSIYLGSKIHNKDKKKVIEIASGKNINVLQMQLSHNQFKMISRVLSNEKP